MTRDRVVVVLVFVLSLAALASGISVAPGRDRPPFDIDEAHKLSESYYYHLFFEQGAARHPDWGDDFYARTNQPVGKYVFGAVLAAAGHPVRDRRLQDDFEALWRTPDELRRRVPDAMLLVTRRISAVYGALLCALAFWTVRRIAGSGLVAPLLLLANGLFVQTARTGLTDAMVLFHLALILPVTLHAIEVVRAGRGRGALVTWAAIVPGIVIALAAGTKLNGVLTGPAYAGGLLGALIVDRDAPRRGRLVLVSLLMSAVAAVVALGVLVALDPALQGAPVAHLLERFAIFRDWLVKQQIDPGIGLFSVRERIAFVALSSLRTPKLGIVNAFGTAGGVVMIVAFCLGVVTLVGRCMTPGPGAGGGRPVRDVVAVLWWIALVLVAVTVWMPVAWDRHAMPAVIAVTLATSIGFGTLPDAARRVTDARSHALAAAVAIAVLGVVVARLTDPSPLDPRLIPGMEHPDVQRSYEERLATGPASPAARWHAGELSLIQGRPETGVRHLEAALNALSTAPDDRTAAVMTAVVLARLAKGREASGDHCGAMRALRDDVVALRRVRAAVRSGDPHVLDAFDQIIAERGAMAGTLGADGGRCDDR